MGIELEESVVSAEVVNFFWNSSAEMYDWACENRRDWLLGCLTRKEYREKLTDARIKRFRKGHYKSLTD